MALDDLDLEFEDEEEAKKKKNDAVMQDVDLEFHLQDEVKPRPSRPPGAPQPPGAQARPQPMAQVKKIDEARRPPEGGSRPAPRPADAQGPRSAGTSALKSAPVSEGHYDLESSEVVQLREQAHKAQFDADVRVQVAEFKIDILSELLSDMKLMDHQINQLLVRINAKHPDLKQEVLMIKKILADYTTKKRK